MAKQVMGGSNNVTASQMKDFFRKVDEGTITKHSLQFFLDNKIFEKKDVIDLLKKLAEQDLYIQTLRNVLLFCGKNDVGYFYQRQLARNTLKEIKTQWVRSNIEGIYNQAYIDFVRECGGDEAVEKILAYEKKLPFCTL